MRWSVEPKRRRIVKVTGVKKASRLSASASFVSQPIPELTSGRSDAPSLRLSIRGDRGVALSSASSATTRELALDGLITAMSAPSVTSEGLRWIVKISVGTPGFGRCERCFSQVRAFKVVQLLFRFP